MGSGLSGGKPRFCAEPVWRLRLSVTRVAETHRFTCNGEPPGRWGGHDGTLITTVGAKRNHRPLITLMGGVPVLTALRGHLQKRDLLAEVWGKQGHERSQPALPRLHPGSGTTPGFKPQLYSQGVIPGRLCNLSEHWYSHV